MMSSSFSFGRILLTLVALFTIIGPFLADWNETHIYNPKWTPHAKFHNGQTMSMGVCLGVSSLYYLWLNKPQLYVQDKGKSSTEEIMRAAEKNNLGIATWLAIMYWITQFSGFWYPDTLGTDPEFGDGAPQWGLDLTMFVVIPVAYISETIRISRA